MADKVYTVAILGTGVRGANVYGEIMSDLPHMFDIVSLCDVRTECLDRAGRKLGVPPENRFTDESEFFKERRADVLVIATQDSDHFRQCTRAFELGYDVLLEKPISDNKEECEALLETQKKYGNKVLVCHVLRYSGAYEKVAEIIERGEIGRLVAIDWIESVGYLRQAHSYVRGNWRNSDISTPMILAKSCHDLDLIQFYAKSRCKNVSSVGDLTYFKPECAPEGAAMRCTECKYIDNCPYSAKHIYIDRWHEAGCPKDVVPYNVIAPAPASEEKLMTAIKEGPYGRCVFHCDNNVVDHQMVQMMFENGIKASFTMTAFSVDDGRRASFYGTMGEIKMDEETIVVKRFGKNEEKIRVASVAPTGCAHGGGDYRLIRTLYQMLEGSNKMPTSLDASIESHLIGIAAEESRLSDGKLVYVH